MKFGDALLRRNTKAGLWVSTALPWCCRRPIKARGEYQETVCDVSSASELDEEIRQQTEQDLCIGYVPATLLANQRMDMLATDLTYALSLAVNHRLHASVLHPGQSWAVAFIFTQFDLRPASTIFLLQISFPRVL